MKTTPNGNVSDTPFIPTKKKKFKPYSSFKKKNKIIRNIEIIAAGVIVIIVAVGIYNMIN